MQLIEREGGSEGASEEPPSANRVQAQLCFLCQRFSETFGELDIHFVFYLFGFLRHLLSLFLSSSLFSSSLAVTPTTTTITTTVIE